VPVTIFPAGPLRVESQLLDERGGTAPTTHGDVPTQVRRALDGLPVATRLRLPEEDVWLGRVDDEGWLRLKVREKDYRLNLSTAELRGPKQAFMVAERRTDGWVELRIENGVVAINPRDPLKVAGSESLHAFVLPDHNHNILNVGLQLHGSSQQVRGARWAKLDGGQNVLSIHAVHLAHVSLEPSADLTNLGILTVILQAIAKSTPPSVAIRIPLINERATREALDQQLNDVASSLGGTDGLGSLAVESLKPLSQFPDSQQGAALQRALEERLPTTPFGKALLAAGYSHLSLDPLMLLVGRFRPKEFALDNVTIIGRRPTGTPTPMSRRPTSVLSAIQSSPGAFTWLPVVAVIALATLGLFLGWSLFGLFGGVLSLLFLPIFSMVDSGGGGGTLEPGVSERMTPDQAAALNRIRRQLTEARWLKDQRKFRDAETLLHQLLKEVEPRASEAAFQQAFSLF
jgi:hypothetical protein